jgi:hypothetical protein
MAKSRRKNKSVHTKSKSTNKVSKKASSAKKAKRKKKVTRRDKEKFPGLHARFFSKIKQEYHDIDYANQLSDKEKDFMSRFMDEWLGARLNHPGKKLHKTKKERKMVYDANNARNRDVMSQGRVKASVEEVYIKPAEEKVYEDVLAYSEPDALSEVSESMSHTNPEDAMIELIDNKRKAEKKLKLIEDRLENSELVKKKKDSSKGT